MTLPVPRPLLPVNQAAHIIVHALQNAPGHELSKPALKALVRHHLGCNKVLLEEAFDRVTEFGYADRIGAGEGGTSVSHYRITVTGKRARMWIPGQVSTS